MKQIWLHANFFNYIDSIKYYERLGEIKTFFDEYPVGGKTFVSKL